MALMMLLNCISTTPAALSQHMFYANPLLTPTQRFSLIHVIKGKVGQEKLTAEDAQVQKLLGMSRQPHGGRKYKASKFWNFEPNGPATCRPTQANLFSLARLPREQTSQGLLQGLVIVSCHTTDLIHPHKQNDHKIHTFAKQS